MSVPVRAFLTIVCFKNKRMNSAVYQAENSRSADGAEASYHEASGLTLQDWTLFTCEIDPLGLALGNRLSMPIPLTVPFHPKDTRRASSDANATAHAQVRVYFHQTTRFANAYGAGGAKGRTPVAGSVLMTYSNAAMRYCLHSASQGSDNFYGFFE